jgi:F-type H+-transporting ATPase subunit gamma
MANERLIKGRIKSAKNIAQITKAMQMVAASKMKRAQALALSGRPYAEKIAEVVATLVKKIDKGKHPLLKKNVTGKRLIVLISTNKGLCGGLNTNLFRSLSRSFTHTELDESGFVTLGKKGELFLVRMKLSLLADFSGSSVTESIPALTTFIVDGFLKGEYKEVYIVYNNFISALKQEPVLKKILPIAEFKTEELTPEKGEELDFLIEPSIDALLDQLLFHYLENQIRDALLEAEASEQSARMIAMKNATDNANDLVGLLTLEYNKARQEKITYEIADIVTARLAVEG